MSKPGPKTGPVEPATQRSVVIEDDLWEAARAIAKRQGVPISTVIRKGLRRYVRRHAHLLGDDQ